MTEPAPTAPRRDTPRAPRPTRRPTRIVVRHDRPTPIWITRRARTRLLLVGVGLTLLLIYLAPSLLVTVVGGIALALVMSFPVRLLARAVPWGWAILISMLLALGLVALGVVVVVPILVEQLGGLVTAAPEFLGRAQNVLRGLLDPLARRGFISGSPESILRDLGQNLVGLVDNVVGGLLGRAGRLVAGTVSTLVLVFGMIFVAIYLLMDERKIKAAYIRAAPKRYRHDARELWDAFGYTLSRYLSGLGLSLAIQGVLSAVALYILGVPYAVLLGFWVAITGLIPYIGSFLGAIPAVALALAISPTTALFTTLVFFGIQQLEGNVLTPKIQGDALRVHPIVVFLAVIAGGELAGLVGILFAVPALAVLRVLVDFFRARVRTIDERRGVPGTLPAAAAAPADWPVRVTPPALPPPYVARSEPARHEPD